MLKKKQQKKPFKARKIDKNTSPDFYWISSLADLVKSFLGNGAGKHSSASCSVSGLLVGVVSDILDELGANVLVLVLQVDGLSYRHSIFSNLRAPPTLFDDDIPSLQVRDLSNLCLFCSHLSFTCQNLKAILCRELFTKILLMQRSITTLPFKKGVFLTACYGCFILQSR